MYSISIWDDLDPIQPPDVSSGAHEWVVVGVVRRGEPIEVVEGKSFGESGALDAADNGLVLLLDGEGGGGGCQASALGGGDGDRRVVERLAFIFFLRIHLLHIVVQ